ncbi:MAG: hypothetical protein AB3N23_08730 [Paracoccaceae bacterium]
MDRYSRWVTFLKVLLPLAAVGLLSTLFLLSRKADPDATIPFADRAIEERLRNQQITAPTYSAISKDGHDILVTADAVSPPIGDQPAKARNISARLDGPRGQSIRMQAARGKLEDTIGRATFLVAVVVETSTGYVIETELLTALLDQSTAHAPGEVKGHGPLGEFRAGSMDIMPKNGTETLHIVFKEGVRLIYDPKLSER